MSDSWIVVIFFGFLLVAPFIYIVSWFWYRMCRAAASDVKISQLKSAYWTWKFKKELSKKGVSIEEIEEEIEADKWTIFKQRKKRTTGVIEEIDKDIIDTVEEKSAKAKGSR